MLYREIMAVCSEIYKDRQIKSVVRKCVEFLKVRLFVKYVKHCTLKDE